MRIATTASSGTGFTGKLYVAEPKATSFTEITLPSDIEGTDFRPTRLQHKGRSYIIGQFSRGIVKTEYDEIHGMGIIAPNSAPTMATGSGSITGNAICSLVYAHLVGNHVIQRSNPGPTADTFSLTAEGRAWSAIPSTAPDGRVTHVEGYCDMDGSGVSHLAFRVPLGTTSITENVPTATLVLRTSLPVKLDADGNAANNILARGAPPYAVFGAKWHSRAWYVDPKRAGVLFSRINEFESVDPTSFIPTKGGEYPTGIAPLENELLVFCQRKVYSLSGFGLSDFSLDQVTSTYGCISHWGIVEIQNMLVFPAEQGISAYFGGGSFRNLMAFSRKDDWKTAYSANQAEYENCVAVDNRSKGQYQLLVTLPTAPKTSIWKGYYLPMVEEGEPEPYWSNDIRTRKTFALGEFFAEGEKRGFLVDGSSDGYVRKEDATDGDDDSDGYNKDAKWRHKHMFFGDQAGHDAHGRQYTDVNWFGKNVNGTVSVKLYGGDDEAGDATTAPKTLTIAAPDSTAPGGQALLAQTSHHRGGLGVAGKGLTVEVTASAPVGVEHRGYAVHHKEGSQARGRA